MTTMPIHNMIQLNNDKNNNNKKFTESSSFCRQIRISSSSSKQQRVCCSSRFIGISRTSNRWMSSCSWIALAAIMVQLTFQIQMEQHFFATAYPVLINVEEKTSRCIRFNIPDGEDAHIAAIVLPTDDELEDDTEIVEDWYVQQLYKLCQRRGKHNTLPRELELDEIPTNVMLVKSNYLKEHHGVELSSLKMKITRTPTTNPNLFQHDFVTKYFKPSAINYIGRTSEAKEHAHKTNTDPDIPGLDKNHEVEHIEGYGLCFVNDDEDKPVQVIYDIILTSDKPYQDDSEGAATDALALGFNKERHLTPLESSLENSIHSANIILREMQYMESREHRMRKTAESINIRVRWFSYISVSVLLSVTYIQVTYLKRYFHKKKLM